MVDVSRRGAHPDPESDALRGIREKMGLWSDAVMVLMLTMMTSSRVPPADSVPHAVPSLHKQ